jgi:hypothetical protein
MTINISLSLRRFNTKKLEELKQNLDLFQSKASYQGILTTLSIMEMDAITSPINSHVACRERKSRGTIKSIIYSRTADLSSSILQTVINELIIKSS